MKTNRRSFIKSSTTAILGSALFPHWLDATVLSKPKSITILHTNDFHSRLEAFPSNHKWAGQGGVTNIQNLLSVHKNEHSLLLDCGDVFQGTPYFNFFKGKVEYEWMNLAGYKASTMGNHEFDLGVQHLADTINQYAQFDMLNCNYNLKDTPLNDIIKPYEIYTVNGLKIGVIGVGLQLDDLVIEENRKGIIYNNPIPIVEHWSEFLKKEKKCNAVVVISHLGYQYNSPKIDDLKLAASTSYVDVILGGHTHTYLTEPTQVINKKGKPVIVNQAHWAGLVLGKIEFTASS